MKEKVMCNHIVGDGTLTPFDTGRERHLKCGVCFEVFWWDGPSLFPPKHPNGKRSFTNQLIAVSAEGVEVLKRT